MPLHICACVVITSFFVLAGGISLMVVSLKSKNEYKWLGVILGIALIFISIWMMLSSGRQIAKHISSTATSAITQHKVNKLAE
jgi:small neutral amino acid transporter SnatA (MarC family)